MTHLPPQVVPAPIAPPSLSRSTPRRVLIVEDDPGTALSLGTNLEYEGYVVAQASSAAEALDCVHHFRPDLILLDLMLPDVSGIHVLRELASGSAGNPVIIASAITSKHDRVPGLGASAGDYATVRFSVLELMARVRKHIDTIIPEQVGSCTDRLRVDTQSCAIWLNGQPIHLTRKEWLLVRRLALTAGKVVSNAELFQDVWGYSTIPRSKTIDVTLSNLRRKLGDDPRHPTYICTVRGLGHYIRREVVERTSPLDESAVSADDWTS